MNCTTCRYELSQCLDGRLPSGRRAVVMQHTEACETCASFWAELQAAQRLALQLQPTRVSSAFREQLWERIRAGEGTPEAVFREQVSAVTKLRYALTGAAAAAGLLLGVTLLREATRSPASSTPMASANGSDAGSGAADGAGEQRVAHGEPTNGPRGDGLQQRPRPAQPVGEGFAEGRPRYTQPMQEAMPFAEQPLVASTQRLTYGLVAVEAAKQLEQRYLHATAALQRLDADVADDNLLAARAWENADEFQAFGEVLLDLRNRQRLSFRDSDVDADLRFAVNMLRQSRHGQRDAAAARAVVGSALHSQRLATVSRAMLLAPSLDPREEMDVLVHLNTQRPEVFRELFVVVGSPADALDVMGPIPEGLFVMRTECGPGFVAPRSEIEAREGLFRVLEQQLRDGMQVRIEISHPR